jgi:uncharacterized protein (DUF1697 family)
MNSHNTPSQQNKQWIAFIRAINGSPHNRIKMLDLAKIVEKAGAQNVTWYLQTGNLFFAAPESFEREELAVAIETELTAHGLRAAEVMLRTPAELDAFIKRDPFVGIAPEEFHRSVSFIRRPPAQCPMAKLETFGARIMYQDDMVLCLAVPKDSDLSGGASAILDKPWGMVSTTRWWHVVEAIAEKFLVEKAEKVW